MERNIKAGSEPSCTRPAHAPGTFTESTVRERRMTLRLRRWWSEAAAGFPIDPATCLADLDPDVARCCMIRKVSPDARPRGVLVHMGDAFVEALEPGRETFTPATRWAATMIGVLIAACDAPTPPTQPDMREGEFESTHDRTLVRYRIAVLPLDVPDTAEHYYVCCARWRSDQQTKVRSPRSAGLAP